MGEKEERVAKMSRNQIEFCVLYVTSREYHNVLRKCYAIAYGYVIEEDEENGIEGYGLDEISEAGMMIREKQEDGSLKEVWKHPDDPKKGAYNVCCVGGSRLISLAKIQLYIEDFMTRKIEDDELDGILSEIARDKFSKKGDKINAVRELNRIKGRIIENKKVEISDIESILDTIIK